MTIEPIIAGSEVIVYDKGRYPIQLELPPGSTLTESETKKILAMSSWEVYPASLADAKEGGRSLILGREAPIMKGNMELAALQLTGVGYQEIKLEGKVGTVKDNAEFYPPNTENFMERVGTNMRTSRVQDGKIVHVIPVYRAMGTYLHDELAEKVKKTVHMSKVQFEKLVTPNVEACGRYLDDGLCNDDGPFGFAVFNAPGVEDRRATETAFDKFMEISEQCVSRDEKFKACHILVATPIAVLVEGLRELHDKGYVHLQPHMSNFYFKNGLAFLVDWSTMQKMGNDPEENVIYRTIDLKRPADDYMKLFSALFENIPEGVKMGTSHRITELVMEVYSGNPEREIHIFQVMERISKTIGWDATEFNMMTQWIKDQGFEGFPKVEYASLADAKRILTRRAAELQMATISRHGGFEVTNPINNGRRKVGANAPCPCGSKKKFKRCCGR